MPENGSLGLELYHCDPDISGPPLCKLGTLDGKYRPRTIQVMGAPAQDIFEGARSRYSQKSCDLMLIGESPGRDDDRRGLPFQGETGELLQTMMTDAGLNLESAYITNIVKCKPPGNRPSAAGEMKACLQHVYWEIRKYRPKLIVLLGRVPLKLFNLHSFGGITKIRGTLYKRKLSQWEDGPEFLVLPTFHPASLLHNPNARRQMRVTEDLRLAGKVLGYGHRPQNVYPVKYEVCHNADDVGRMVDRVLAHGKVSLDTESPGLKFRTDPMILLQLSIGEALTWLVPFYRYDLNATPWKIYPYLANNPEVQAHLERLFSEPKLKVVAHNAGYDAMVVRRWVGMDIAGELHDVGCMHHLLDENPPHELEVLAATELGVGDYGFAVREIVGHSKKARASYDNIPDEVLWPYGATDAEVGYRLAEIYSQELARKPHLLRIYREEVMPAIRYMAEAQWNGFRLEKETVLAIKEHYEERRERVVAECRRLTVPDFNPGSNDQVAKHMKLRGFEDEIQNPTSASGVTTDKSTLLKIDDPLADNIIQYRRINKRLSTYIEPVLEDVEEDGRVRYGLKIPATVTGRQSAKIVHQMPRVSDDNEIPIPMRAMFGEEEGYLIIYYDFDQFELRIMATLSGERKLIETLDSGGDIHALTAAIALGVDPADVSEFNRSGVGKPLNFGSSYGSEGAQISELKFENPHNGNKIEIVGETRAKEFLARFWEEYPAIRQFKDTCVDEALCNNCTAVSIFGRERHLPHLLASNPAKQAHAERECVNFHIQSPAASILTRSVCRISQEIERRGLSLQRDARLLTAVHDSGMFGALLRYVEMVAQMIKECAEAPVPEIQNRSFPISMGVGRTWAEAEKDSKREE